MGPKFYKKKTQNTYKQTNLNIGNAIFLVIVESPSKCGKIESYLGTDYKCIASKGHIRELNGLKNIDIKNNFHPTFEIISEKRAHIQQMKTIIEKFSKKNIILATDDDREGEGIAWHICEVFNLPIETTPRIIFHEITRNALQNAIQHPQTINMNLVHAQHARQILDVLVGFKISPHLWKHIYSSKENPLSAGRCQTPALRLIYDNEKERQNSQAQMKYKTTGFFTEKNIEFVLGFEFDESTQVEEFLKKSQFFDHMLTIEKEKESKKSPPKPFNTSKLLQSASNQLHTNPKTTMSLCQTLYQNGLITYMRTDSTKYAPPFLECAKKYIEREFGNNYVGNLGMIENKDKNNPHEAIRVTDINITNIPNAKESAMYRLIWRNTVESCMSEAKYKNTQLIISAPSVKIEEKTKKMHYSHTLEMPTFLGWKQLTTKEMDQETIIGLKYYLQSIQANPILYSKIECNAVLRNKVQYYNESSLIKKLEDMGIGRPSTFAMIVNTIQDRGYVKNTDIIGETSKIHEYTMKFKQSFVMEEKEKSFGNEKSKLQLQPIGELCIHFLTKYFHDLFAYDYTSAMEVELDNIATTNEKIWYELCNKCNNEIISLSKNLSKVEKEKYKLDDAHEVIFTQYGPSIKKTEDGKVSYYKMKNLPISINNLKTGSYNLHELIDKEPETLGNYNNYTIQVKSGKYGNYLEYGDNRVSIKDWKHPISELTRSQALQYIEDSLKKKEKSVLREINGEMSVRSGKYGPYVFYQTKQMKKPSFFTLKKCPIKYETCEKEEIEEYINTTFLQGK